MKFIITGDTHGSFERFSKLPQDKDIAIIILGDVGLNFYMRKKDYWNKLHLCNSYPFTFYCVRGNHEARPQDVKGMKLVYDEAVQGLVWAEEDFPRIKYFQDWGIYNIENKKTLVIGGAYSVDKLYRLKMHYSWFANEQLSEQERLECLSNIKGQKFDMVLSHTCPYSWRPIDLFLSNVDESTVDTSMEQWFEEVKDSIEWEYWFFGHYHDNRIVRIHVEMFFESMEFLEDIFARWHRWDAVRKGE